MQTVTIGRKRWRLAFGPIARGIDGHCDAPDTTEKKITNGQLPMRVGPSDSIRDARELITLAAGASGGSANTTRRIAT